MKFVYEVYEEEFGYESGQNHVLFEQLDDAKEHISKRIEKVKTEFDMVIDEKTILEFEDEMKIKHSVFVEKEFEHYPDRMGEVRLLYYPIQIEIENEDRWCAEYRVILQKRELR